MAKCKYGQAIIIVEAEAKRMIARGLKPTATRIAESKGIDRGYVSVLIAKLYATGRIPDWRRLRRKQFNEAADAILRRGGDVTAAGPTKETWETYRVCKSMAVSLRKQGSAPRIASRADVPQFPRRYPRVTGCNTVAPDIEVRLRWYAERVGVGSLFDGSPFDHRAEREWTRSGPLVPRLED